MRTIMVFLLMCGVAVAGEIHVRPSAQKTSKDTGLEFICESAKMTKVGDVDYLEIHGTVQNTGQANFQRVKVVFTIKDENEAFITRGDMTTEPPEIGVGEVGYLYYYYIVKMGTPALVEYNILGK